MDRTMTSIALALVLLGSTASAAPVTPNVGVLESQVVPDGDHLGFYGYLGVSTSAKVGPLLLIPELLVEWAPEGNHWGAVAVLTTDYPLNDCFGADLIVAVAHDQPGPSWHAAAFGAGPGIGLSAVVEAWTFSPFAIVYKNLGAPGWTWTPGLNVAWSPPWALAEDG